MRILCVTIGSSGDVHPFVGIGLELRSRGHEVTIVTNEHFQPLIERVGLKFIQLDTAEKYREGLKNPNLWHRRKAFKLIMEWGVLPLIRPTYDIIAREAAGGDTLVIASTLAMGARLAQDKLGIPTVTVHLAPSVFRSTIDPPVLPGIFMPRWLPRSIKRWMFEAGDRFVIDPVLQPINDVRKELGLPQVAGILKDWWHSPLLTLGLFPDWFAPPPPDWPGQLRLTGFPLYDESATAEMPPDLEAFLQAGPPPIAFTAGTAMAHGRQFFAVSIDAAHRLGRRALLITQHPEQLPAELPPHALHVCYAPFSALLPRCCAIVHHGGIGTTSQSLQAGIPQLVYMLAHDQPDNAARLRRLRLGDSIRPAFYRPRSAARKLHRLLASPTVRAACVKAKMRFLGSRSIERACDEIEGLMNPSA